MLLAASSASQPSLLPVLSSIGGVLLGALVAGTVSWAVTGRQIKSAERARARDGLRDLLATFWGSCDSAWRKAQDLTFLIIQIQTSRHDVTQSKMQELDDERRDLLTARAREVETAERALALIRILHPRLADPATHLLDASRSYRFVNRKDGADPAQQARDEALTAFEAAARIEFEAPATGTKSAAR